MKVVITLFIVSLFSFNVSGNEDLIFVRNLFYRASKSSSSADTLSEFFKNAKLQNRSEMNGYKGMSKLMLCYHSYNPYIKLRYFLEGKDLLELSIKSDPQNIELRFLRLTVQLNTPSFLGYKGNISEDKKKIFEGAQCISDTDLLLRIYNYTRTAKNLTLNEKQTMQKALLSNKLAVTILK